MLAVALAAGGLVTAGVLPATASAHAAQAASQAPAAFAPAENVAPRLAAAPLTVGLPTGCNPNIVNGNTSLGPNNGNGLGDDRFYTYDTVALDDRANLKVNVANGNLVVHLDLLHIKGTLLDEDVAAFYNVQGSGTSEIGNRWLLSPGPDVKLAISGGGSSVTFVAPGGYQTTFSNASGGIYQDQPGLDATLVKNGDGSFALSFHKTGECFAFNSAGQLTTDSEKNGHQLAFAYNGSGLLSSITDTQNRVTSFSYNSNNLLQTITDPIGRTISFSYDVTNTYLKSITDAASATTNFGYDGTSGNLTSVTDPNGHATTLSYASTRVATLTDATGAKTTFSYGVSGTQCPSGTTANQVTDANSHTTTYCYSASTLQVGNVYDALGHERSSSYTPDENVATLTDPLTNLSTFTWSTDGKNNLSGVTDATGASTSFGYASGNPYLPATTTDAQGTVLAYTYDSPGNLTSVKDNTHNQNLLLDTYTYNSSPAALNGTIASATNGDNHKTTFGYDTSGNLTSVTPPSGGVLGGTTLTYDGVSRVKSVTDGRGLVTQFAYDNDDRITTITYNDHATVSYVYDANGNVQSEADVNGTTSFTDDHDNRELTKSQPNGFSLTYSYDPVGNLATLTDPGGTVSYAYNAVNDLTTLTEPDGTTQVTFRYDNDDRRTQTAYPNGVTQTIGYDNAGRELSVIGTHGSTTLTSFTYCYVTADPCPTTGSSNPSTNLRQWVTDGVANTKTSYSYDSQDRLTDAKVTGNSSAEYAYTYDAASNLTQAVDTANGSTTTVVYTVDPDNALSAETINGTHYSFAEDGDGNLTSWSGGWSLAYNAQNQTTSASDGGANQTQSYAYSGPTQQEVLSATVSGGDNPYTLQFANSALGETYQQGTNSFFTQAFARDNRGGLVSKSASAGSYDYYLFDGLGSVVAVTDGTGSVANRYAYDPYGNLTENDTTLYNPFEYVSGWTGAAGFTHFGQRWYATAPYYDRWTQQDPVAGSLGNPTAQCRYAYASDDPVNLTDPAGTVSKAACGFALAATAVDTLIFAGAIPALPVALFVAVGFGVAAIALDQSAGGAVAGTTAIAGGINATAVVEGLELGSNSLLGAVAPFLDLVAAGYACGLLGG